MKQLNRFAMAALLGASALALTVPAASARIICNDDGDCWHAKTEYTYPSTVHFAIHPDDWKWKESEHYHWREHEGPGYWHNRTWTTF